MFTQELIFTGTPEYFVLVAVQAPDCGGILWLDRVRGFPKFLKFSLTVVGLRLFWLYLFGLLMVLCTHLPYTLLWGNRIFKLRDLPYSNCMHASWIPLVFDGSTLDRYSY